MHYRRLADAAHALTMRFESRPGAYVGVNMLVYDERGNPRRHLSPDVFVAFGVTDRQREIYKLWEDESPAFVLEVTSKTTRREDRRKKSRYARWGVAEYFSTTLAASTSSRRSRASSYRAPATGPWRPPCCPTANPDFRARPSVSVYGSTGPNSGSTTPKPAEPVDAEGSGTRQGRS